MATNFVTLCDVMTNFCEVGLDMGNYSHMTNVGRFWMFEYFNETGLSEQFGYVKKIDHDKIKQVHAILLYYFLSYFKLTIFSI